MVTATRGLAKGLLPDMRHFMGERREDHFISASGETVRIQSEFMDRGLIDATVKPFRGKVTSRLRMALQSYQHLRQTTVEQCTVEKVVGVLESLIFGSGKSLCLHNC